MASATFTFFHEFKAKLGAGDIALGSDTFKAYLSNAAPTAATHDEKADLAEISATGGYAAKTLTCTYVETAGGSGTWRFTAADETWTASGAAFDQFRYVIVYDDTVLNDPLVGYLDHGAAVDLADGDSYTLNTDANGTLFTLA